MRIELRGVTKRFRAVAALRDVTLTVPAGRRVALVGPNGSGKSTLTRAILGLISVEGEVLLDGRSPFADRVAVASRLAYVPQTAPALSAPVSDVVRLVCETRGISVTRIAAAAARFDLDILELRARPFRNLSGGMKQKLLLALAFAARPSLLILDEPTASLDTQARERFLELCAELPAQTTLLLCSHRLEELTALADHVVALEDGRVAHDGPLSSFLEEHRGLPEVRDA